MQQVKKMCGMVLLGLAGSGLTGCLNAPNYPNEPSIEFNKLTLVRNKPTGQVEVDTLKFALNFRDGDGDLGLSSGDTTGEFGFKHGLNRTYNNYFIQPFIKGADGNFSAFAAAANGEYNGRYQRLTTTDTKSAPIKGVLNYRLPLSVDGLTYFPGQTFRFEISILDRALHESNQITTTEVTLGK